jgi:hypothetical protein
MERVVTLLAGLPQAEVNTLASEGCTSGEDLSLCTLLDIEQMLSDTPVVKRRKLSMIGRYITRGQTIEEATTMPTVASHLNTIAVAAAAPNLLLSPLPPPPPGPSPFQDPNRGAPKLYTNAIENFSGSPMDFEACEKKTRALLGQTSYKGLMTTPPEATDLVSQKRNRELYHMFMTAIMDGSGLHIINGIAEPDGHAAWKAIHD